MVAKLTSLGEIEIDGHPINEMTDSELLAWMQRKKSGYKMRGNTAAIWLAVMRSLDQQGPPMTVRGLFYNCENVYHVVPKTDAGYQQTSKQILAMRRSGVLPYRYIADHTRWVRKPKTYTGLESYFEEGRKAYRRALWDNQTDYVEVWCEKDAIAGILYEITDEWDVPLLVVRGYTSETFAYNAAENIKAQEKPCFIYYFGDWDKHGLGISQNIKDKLSGFGAYFTFKRVAVLPWQIEAWNLPTRPPKGNDWGDCVEIDALPANTLRKLLEQYITRHIDLSVYEETIRVERLERKTLLEVQKNWGLASNST